MDPMLIITAVSSVIGLVGQILPLIGGNNSAAIGGIIKTLSDITPLAIDQLGVTYTAIKNIIASVREHPATLEEQLAALDALDKRVDDAWDAIEGQLDPDAPSAA